MHVEAGAAGHGGQAPQPVDDRYVAIALDGKKPRAHQRRAIGEPVADRAGGNAEQGRNDRALERAGGEPLEHGRTEHDVIDHRLDDGLRVIAQQQLQNCDVRSIEAGRLCQALQPPRREVRLGLRPRRALVPQGLLKDAPFAPGKLIVRIDVRSIQAGAKPPAGEGYALLVLHHPFSQRIRRPIAVTEPRSGIGEVGDDQMAFVIGCHGSLRVWGLERI